MAKTTGIIRYNVHDRGRKHIGKDRHFDLRAMAALINSPALQEKVRNRDLIGYYGHIYRMKFGLVPPEVVVVDGKTINIEPAVVTTYLHADEEGNIEHETEFLDNSSGKIAARLHGSKTGGFSSAIFATPRGNLDVPTGFHGFDYVLEPNYTTNRGYLFDSASMAADGMVLDSALIEFQESNRALSAMYDSLQGDHLRALQTISQLMEENEHLLSASTRGASLLDSAGAASSQRPMMINKRATTRFEANNAGFKTADLAVFESLDDDTKKPDKAMELINRAWGIEK